MSNTIGWTTRWTRRRGRKARFASAASFAALAWLAVACDGPGPGAPSTAPATQTQQAAADEAPAVPAAPTRPAAARHDDWCLGHDVPESMCTKCNPELLERFEAAGDWCAEHEFPESVCPVCNPMAEPLFPGDEGYVDPDELAVAGAGSHEGHGHAEGGHVDHGDGAAADPRDWCAGHGLPESKCTKCNPELTDGFRESGDWCAEHGYPESACPFCNPVKPPPGVVAPGPFEPGTKIRFKSPALERAVGIESVGALDGALGASVEATARIEFNENAVANVRSIVSGIVREVRVDLGARVSQGDPLFTLASVDVAELQARSLGARERARTARENLARQKSLRASEINSTRQVELANQELEVAQAELRALERSLSLSGASKSGRSGRYTVRAPIEGSVVRRPARIGTLADSSAPLATIADTTTMWALIDVPEWDAAQVRPGHRVEVRVDGVVARTFQGEISWIASDVDPRTRTVQARAELSNPDGLLRAGQFARAKVKVGAPTRAVMVPLESVQRMGAQAVVFARLSEGVYEPRVVRTGRSNGRLVQVEGELTAGDAIVTTGAFLLKTELSRDAIGAGCCEVDAPGGH